MHPPTIRWTFNVGIGSILWPQLGGKPLVDLKLHWLTLGAWTNKNLSHIDVTWKQSVRWCRKKSYHDYHDHDQWTLIMHDHGLANFQLRRFTLLEIPTSTRANFQCWHWIHFMNFFANFVYTHAKVKTLSPLEISPYRFIRPWSACPPSWPCPPGAARSWSTYVYQTYSC